MKTIQEEAEERLKMCNWCSRSVIAWPHGLLFTDTERKNGIGFDETAKFYRITLFGWRIVNRTIVLILRPNCALWSMCALNVRTIWKCKMVALVFQVSPKGSTAEEKEMNAKIMHTQKLISACSLCCIIICVVPPRPKKLCSMFLFLYVYIYLFVFWLLHIIIFVSVSHSSAAPFLILFLSFSCRCSLCLILVCFETHNKRWRRIIYILFYAAEWCLLSLIHSSVEMEKKSKPENAKLNKTGIKKEASEKRAGEHKRTEKARTENERKKNGFLAINSD